ncbi:MAG: polyribonucleotide nucleotidyltransferase [Planctomycetota bacterium]
MAPDPIKQSFQLLGTDVTLETGRIARQASAAVVARMGDNLLLATATLGPKKPNDFFPLTVEYREKFAAAGRIPGSFQRREGRISDHEVLQCRLIDRTLRSLFPKGYTRELQVQVQVFSADPNADLATLGIVAACAAIHLSEAPAEGPAAGLRIVQHKGSFSPFGTLPQRNESDLDFLVSGGPSGLVMVEGGANEVAESTCVEALEQAQEWIQKIAKAIGAMREQALAKGLAQEKEVVEEAPALPELPADIRLKLEQALSVHKKADRNDAIAAVKTELADSLGGDDTAEATMESFDKARSQIVRERVLRGGDRLDGRDATTVRPIWTEIDWLPRTHGSSIFTRGETQALVSCTLGTAEEAQRVDGIGGLQDEHFLLHYNFPPYSVGETRPLRGPGRREIGHGFLARRGLVPVMPPPDEFPYTIRLESEISESNGSSSMATACGGCLALMSAGVPLKRPVAGIAMGLISDGERTVTLTDILGDEDHLGDMDFKVVGSEEGVTAIQLDNKIGGLTKETLAGALDQAKTARLHILQEMAKTISEPRPSVNTRAPQVLRTVILPSSVGALIGPRGQTIKGITQSTGAKVQVNDEGVVRIYATDGDSARKGLRAVGQAAGIPRRGGYYKGTVANVRDFGCFVKLNEVCEGLVGRGELYERGQKPDKEFEPGDEMIVRVIGIDERGRLALSRRAAFGVDESDVEW